MKCKDRATCLKEAETLRAQHKYFRWPETNALIGWLRHGGACVYCDKNLMADWESLFGSAHTDHLLPRSYEEILWDDWNLVLCCSVCNSLKRHYDANECLPMGVPPEQGGRYVGALCANMTETSCVTAISEQGGKENQHGDDERFCSARCGCDGSY